MNHDALMVRIAPKVRDKRLLKLIGAYLRAGVLIDGLIQPIRLGVGQGGPLSPLLANIMLDDLDNVRRLVSLGVDLKRAVMLAGSSKGPYRLAKTYTVQCSQQRALSLSGIAFCERVVDQVSLSSVNRRMRIRMPGGGVS